MVRWIGTATPSIRIRVRPALWRGRWRQAPGLRRRKLARPARHARLDRNLDSAVILAPNVNVNLQSRGWRARSEERRVGKGGVSTCRSWGSPYHSQKKKLQHTPDKHIKKALLQNPA